MSNAIQIFMSAITLALACAGPVSHAQVRFADYQRRAPIYEGCQQLAQMAVSGWVDIERSENITCLDSNYISQGGYDRMMSGFLQDCTNAVVAKLGDRIDQEGDHDINLSRHELTLMFVQHYDPVFREFCSTRNPGKGINTQPARTATRG